MTTPSKAKKGRQPNDAAGPSKRRGSAADDIFLTGDQFRELMASLSTTKELVRKGTFTTCTARFQDQRDRNTLERFIAAATTFKAAENIGDQDALIKQSILLGVEAGTWWLGGRDTIETWDDVSNGLRYVLVPMKRTINFFGTEDIIKIGNGALDESRHAFAYIRRKANYSLRWLFVKRQDRTAKDGIMISELLHQAQIVNENFQYSVQSWNAESARKMEADGHRRQMDA
jgi:hypothetical protein